MHLQLTSLLHPGLSLVSAAPILPDHAFSIVVSVSHLCLHMAVASIHACTTVYHYNKAGYQAAVCFVQVHLATVQPNAMAVDQSEQQTFRVGSSLLRRFASSAVIC